MTTPNPTQKPENGPTPEHDYLVTAEEIAQTPLRAKLVVLSGGWSWFDRGYADEGFHLAGAFLAAGNLSMTQSGFFIWGVKTIIGNKDYMIV